MKQISTDKAPAAIGPYSQGFVSGNILFSAGQIALDPATGALVGGLIRFVVHFISGITIYKIVGPTELFNVTYTDPWMYSLAYNMGYMLPSTLLVAVLGLLLQSRLEKIKK